MRRINHMPATFALFLAFVLIAGAMLPTKPLGAQEDPGYMIEINKGTLIRLGAPASAVMIADPQIADVQVISPTLVYVNGRTIGETTILAVDNNDGELLHSVVTVTHNLSRLNRTLKTLMPDHKVQVDSVAGALVLNGDVLSPMEADNVRAIAAPFLQKDETLINMVNSEGSDQVTLMVKVAEVQRSELKRFGIHLENIFNTGNFIFGIGQGRELIGDAGEILRSGLDNSLYVGHRSGSSDINGVIDALEDEGLINLLAEPNLTTMSGQAASFLAGGEFPVPVVGEDGAVTIEYRPFGVSLSFTPAVLSKDKISLQVTPEVSNISQTLAVQVQGFNIPSLITRRATTTVELGSGQSFAIAGLLQNDISNDVSKFPGLGDIPILGALFRSSEFRNDQTELVIIVTPYMVSGVPDQMLATPVDGYQPATDIERILLGRLYHEQEPGEDGTVSVQHAIYEDEMPRLNGPAGYVLK